MWELSLSAFILIGSGEWESVCTLTLSSCSLQLFSTVIPSHLPHGGCPGFSEDTSHAEAAWTEDSDLGSGWLGFRKCLWEVSQLQSTKSADLVKAPGAPPVHQGLHRGPLKKAGCSASVLDFLGLGKPRLLLSLTWPEGALWAPGVHRTRHTGAGNSLFCRNRNSVLALGRRKIRVIARGRGYSHGGKDKQEGTALESALQSCCPPWQKQTVKSTSQVSSCAGLHFLRTVYLSYNF